MRFSVRSTVVLPQPDGPMNAVISLAAMSSFDVVHGQVTAVVHLELRQLEHDLALLFRNLVRRLAVVVRHHDVDAVGESRDRRRARRATSPRRRQ